jgi:predicted DNA-binding transcriptional regulator YafY
MCPPAHGDAAWIHRRMVREEVTMPATPPNYGDGLNMVRILQMLERTRRRSILLDVLAERLEVHRRTARRYVQAMQASLVTAGGAPLVTLEGRGVRAAVLLAQQPEPSSARLYQYAAVFAATRTVTTGGGSVLGDSAEHFVATMAQGFEPRLLPLVRRVQESFVYIPFGPKDYRASEEVLDTLVQASVYRRPLTLRYRTASGWTYRCHFEPWTLVLYRDALFIHGPQRGVGAAAGLRLLAVDRVQEAELIRHQSFEVPDDYDPEACFANQLGLWQDEAEPERVRIAFTPAVALSAKERRWPGQVGWSDHQGERSVLELVIPVTPEVLTWVLTWGAEAEVLEPPSLRDQVQAVLRSALGQYGG